MRNNILEKIRKTNPDCVVEKPLNEYIAEMKRRCGVETIKEMEALIEAVIHSNEK